MGQRDPGAHAATRSVRWLVSGRVQGVGFRWFVRRAAEDHGVVGDVRNLPDGRLEIRASGDSNSLARLLADVRRGPAGSRVEHVDVAELEPELFFDAFTIRH